MQETLNEEGYRRMFPCKEIASLGDATCEDDLWLPEMIA